MYAQWRETMATKISNVLLVMLLLGCVCLAQDEKEKRTAKPSTVQKDQEFDAQMKQLEDAWVNEFNAGHADKVAQLYADDAVLMRWDGSVHGRDSILAEFQRSIAGGTHGYIVHSLHRERSGDLAY